MKKFFLPRKTERSIVPISSEKFQENIYPDRREKNIADGGEFLDDFWRMKDQPLGETVAEEDE
ncbi:hypothetical protein [Terrimonas sp.]|uniref:hypothetical protein n=1 Tax=Terrimonas sp. TaxID=1914338 RepID=UPI001056FFC4|nr:hypothetical protein [Terrimonas sp.]